MEILEQRIQPMEEQPHSKGSCVQECSQDLSGTLKLWTLEFRHI